jgi:hypothetical protein
MICVVPNMPPAAQTMPAAPMTINRRPKVFCAVNDSFRIAAASIATMSGITPGNKAPAWAAGANSRPALTNRTMGAPHPATMAATPSQPKRSSASPFFKAYGSNSKPATAKRIAATSQGVRVVRTPRRDTTIKPAQMHTAARP